MKSRPSRRHAMTTVVVLAGLLVGCGGPAPVTPIACDLQLATETFRVCLPADAEVDDDVPTGRRQATVGNLTVVLEEARAQDGDPDEAAFAALTFLISRLGRERGVAPSPDGLVNAVAIAEEGFISIPGTDGGFSAPGSLYDTGQADHLAVWGRGATVGDLTGAVAVIRDFGAGTQPTPSQLDETASAAMPIISTLTPR